MITKNIKKGKIKCKNLLCLVCKLDIMVSISEYILYGRKG
jgi:hypothetical protein